MTEVNLQIEELIGVGHITKAHELTLQHALAISPHIKERTIGPDLPEFKVEAQDVFKEDNLLTSKKIPEKANPTTSKTIIIAPVLNQSSLQNFDLDMMNAAVLSREAEGKRKKHIRQTLIEIQEKQLASIRVAAEHQRKLQEQKQQELLAERRRNEAQIIAEAEQQTKRDLQECEQQMEALRLHSKRQLQLISFQGIAQYQGAFRSKYETIAMKLIVVDKQGLFPCGDYNRQLKQLVELFEQLTGKIKSGECGAAELKMAEELCKKLDALLAAIDEDLENLVKEKQKAQQRKAEEELKAATDLSKDKQTSENEVEPRAFDQPVAAAKVQTQLQPSVEATASTSQPAVAVAATVLDQSANAAVPLQPKKNLCQAFYNEIYGFYQEKVDSVKPLQLDENMKKYRFACQKAINIPLNAISAVSPQHLQDKFEKIFNFLNGQPFKSAEGQVSVNDHPLGRTYCLLLTAKRFVNQGETAISSNPQAAFPVASVVVSLWKLIPEFGKLFLAYVFKESPFLVPICGQSVAEYNDLKRQAGITRLYSAVMITSGRKAEGPSHPYGLEFAWRWLVDFSFLEPLPDISATLIMEVLQTVGHKMCQAYGKQFTKLLLYLQRSYFQRLAAVDEGGPKTRLEMLLINYMNQIPEPQGVLPNAFW